MWTSLPVDGSVAQPMSAHRQSRGPRASAPPGPGGRCWTGTSIGAWSGSRKPPASCSRAAAPPGWGARRRVSTGTARRCCAARPALVARAVDGPVVVVAAPGQELPELPPGVEVVDDPVEGPGPLQGLAAGLAAVARPAPARLRLLDRPAVPAPRVRPPRSLRALADGRRATSCCRSCARLPAAAGRRATATALAGAGGAAAGRGGPARRRCCSGTAASLVLDDAALLADAALARPTRSWTRVLNVNDPDDYAAALARPEPEVVVQRFGVLAGGGRRATAAGRAATLGAAAAAVGLALDRHVVAAVNGDQIARDAAPAARRRRHRRLPVRRRRRLRPTLGLCPPAATSGGRWSCDVGGPRGGERAAAAAPTQVLRAYLGGVGLGTWLLHRARARRRRPARARRRRWRSCSPRWSAPR